MSGEFAPDEPEFFLGDPHAVFRRLRREDPLPWYRARAAPGACSSTPTS